MRSVESFLIETVEADGSDLHFKTDTGKAYLRVHGDLLEVEAPSFTNEEFRAELYKLLRPQQIVKFERDLELDFSFELPGISRFRGNAYQQRGHVQAAFRVIPYEIQSMEDLNLPPATYDFIERPRGLVLVTGPAGSGKSTTLAAMLDRINRTQPVHIVTVEDPIEFVHEDHVALINQRELEVDTVSFANALKYVLRQDPDVILVGEMRDLETIHLAITAAETGHLVFGTLHTVDSIQTVDRIVDVFPTHQQQQIRMQLSVNLVGVVSQTLVRRKDGRGRIAAHEVMVATSAIRNLVRESKTYQIGSIIQTGAKQRMNTLDQALANLVERGLVTKEDARQRSKDPMEFDRLLAIDAKKAAPTPQGPAAGTYGSNRQQTYNGQQPPVNPSHHPHAPVRNQPNRPAYRRD
ncbi:type IV pilus twitching motility protein PilT [Fimbriimonas ginsengisoli]|uniref:Twitching motility protein PilT n=1 Tax=Fimbriimonas ginsengisoli Gsoil 348 TaxID=661478 RepID=A0A068NII4_FIMGI|nr:type IV pilus twitching motility protein PilT [Fimbriimonas ginsengisoli]AIE83418.1 Twitching motility protein PilT [Fimbriimonas ginsengisoli Gsoil 348]